MCNQCREHFPSLAELNRHTLELHNSFRCNVCKAKFTQRSNLQRHSLKHNLVKTSPCPDGMDTQVTSCEGLADEPCDVFSPALSTLTPEQNDQHMVDLQAKQDEEALQPTLDVSNDKPEAFTDEEV
ncbi:unnamed protein product [Dibothriocephalus latus]|uniref:C2H2-type domain-containing protein n=1 Tax=Dibothriocephalus latus TaxID=60516 RepID=A0A3P7MM85_DIBLA|nr:unnamed protein product [Dibothriocephalus latus]